MAGPIRISVLADAGQARRELSGVANDTATLGSKIGKFGKVAGAAAAAGLAVAGAAAIKFGIDSVKSASDAQQSLGATETVFGKYADTVIKRSNDAATAIGISANEYRELSNVVGASLTGAGLSIKEATRLTGDLNTRAADMAATFGGTTREAVEAVSSALRGETDPIERYGVSVKAVDVSARLAAQGQDQLTGSALKAAEMQARLDLIMEKTALTQGAFGRESNTLANQQQVLAAQFENIKAKVGEALLPVLTDLLTFVNTSVIPNLGTFKDILLNVADAFAPVVDFARQAFDAFKGSDEAGGKMSQLRETVQQVWESIKSIFESTVSIIQSLWTKFGDTILNYASSTFDNIIQVVKGAFQIIQGIFNVVSGILKGDWKQVWDGIKQILSGAWNVIEGVVKQGWNFIKTAFTVGATVLKDLWDGLWNAIKSLASNALGAVKSAISGGWDGIKGLTESAWNGIKTLISRAWDNIKEAVSNGIGRAVDLVRGLPDRITSALGNLGSLLFNAGKDILQGLLDGITSMIGNVRDKLGEVTNLIPDWKGPPAKDRTLLRGAGQLIMQGLVDGFEDGKADVRRSLEGVTRDIASTVIDPTTSLTLGTANDPRVTARRTTASMATLSGAGATAKAVEDTALLSRAASEQQLVELRALVGEMRGLRDETRRFPGELARRYGEERRVARP